MVGKKPGILIEPHKDSGKGDEYRRSLRQFFLVLNFRAMPSKPRGGSFLPAFNGRLTISLQINRLLVLS